MSAPPPGTTTGNTGSDTGSLLRSRWQRLPAAWRGALVATAALWLATSAVLAVAAGTLPAHDPVGVDAQVGFDGWDPPPVDATGGELIGSGLVRFDALWYLAIAADGYPQTTEVPQAAAFFPGYPMVVAALGWLLGGRLVLAAQLVSLLACIAALAGLARLAAMISPRPERSGDHELSQRAMLVAVAFPTGFFLLAPYAEAMFLAAAVWALVHAARGRPLLAALLVAVATATRPVGALLVVPLLLGVVRRDPVEDPPVSAPHAAEATVVAGLTRRDLVERVVPTLGVAVALGALLLHGWVRWGDPLAVVTAQSSWQRGLTAPWTSVTSAVRFALQDLGGGATGYHLLDLLVITAALVGVVALARVRQWPLVAHALANALLWLVQPFPARPLLSAPRFALVVPGVLLGLAVAVRTPGRERLWLPVSGALFGIHLALFTRWWFVF